LLKPHEQRIARPRTTGPRHQENTERRAS